MERLTSAHRVLTRGYYWRIELTRTWPAQRGEELAAYLSAVRESQEPISLCLPVRREADPLLAIPADLSYSCRLLRGYLYPEARRSGVPTDSVLSEDGNLIAIILELSFGVGWIHQWRLTKTTGTAIEPDRLN
jgi:hypothetical protein